MKKNIIFSTVICLVILAILTVSIKNVNSKEKTNLVSGTTNMTFSIVELPETTTKRETTTEVETTNTTKVSTTSKTTISPKSSNTPSDSSYNYISKLVHEICDDMHFDPKLILAVIRVESNFVPTASNKYCYGLMQIAYSNFSYFRNLGYDPATVYGNIQSGTYLLKLYSDKYGSYEKALMCYNFGEQGAQAKWKQGIYHTNYTSKVMSYYGTYE